MRLGLFNAAVAGLSLAALSASAQTAPGAPSAKTLFDQVLARYDRARTFEATITSRFVTRAAVGKTVIHAQAETDGRSRIARSRIEMSSDVGGGKRESVRIDDGQVLWTLDANAKAYRHEARRPDKLSNLFRPFLESFNQFIPKMTVRESRVPKENVYRMSGAVQGRGKAEIVIDRATMSLKSAIATRPDGGSMILTVTGEAINRPIPADRFRFAAPPGAKPLPDPRPGGVFGRPPG